MDAVLWTAAALLALVALTGGISKTFVAREHLAAVRGGGWTAHAGDGFVRTLGLLELAAALGLLLPALLGIAPVLVPVTAVCWVALMLGAMLTHGRRGEFALVALNFAYLALAALLAWGRFGPYRF
ncbi:DoxX family protein [Streptomyces sp. NPDC001255]|uniref:DoxX family protein n=1 Tax=Streptomyces sp. NPDC001255 TaxID=3364550 RepID=UPI0036B8E276